MLAGMARDRSVSLAGGGDHRHVVAALVDHVHGVRGGVYHHPDTGLLPTLMLAVTVPLASSITDALLLMTAM
jgi:hypothetical protein